MNRDLGMRRGEVMEKEGDEAKEGPGEDIVRGGGSLHRVAGRRVRLAAVRWDVDLGADGATRCDACARIEWVVASSRDPVAARHSSASIALTRLGSTMAQLPTSFESISLASVSSRHPSIC